MDTEYPYIGMYIHVYSVVLTTTTLFWCAPYLSYIRSEKRSTPNFALVMLTRQFSTH
ncbi:hypothetical protein BDV33DRAFT_90399 [Aspergillus novoparasiticus]|uniref:Uncharacterized protein n=1 Tax=Aspergillus novoparasiticus TaxID=986946 RepID=A0A5N6ESQ2_9EURO|nr:hypothetical protein BDV33DRAFT_90399 [Aspergillus novoparasiticus]